MASLRAARQLSLYLLSLLAVASAEIAWLGARPLRLLAHAAALGFTLLLGDFLADALSGLGAAGWRKRARLVALVSFGWLGFLAVMAAIADPLLAARAAEACALLQAAALLLAEVLGLHLAVLGTALILVILAGLAGGAPAAVAVTGFLVTVSFFLAFDHTLRRLQSRPTTPEGRLLRATARGAARMVAPVALVLTLVFVAAPPTRSASSGIGVAGPVAVEQVRRAYLWLFLLAVGGGGAVLALARLFRGAESGAVLLEDLETQVESEELLEAPRLDESRYGAARGRVIRAYLTFLSRARDAGYEIAAHLTPGEIQLRVRQPEAPLAELTGVFLDARYGPDEPSNEAVRIAERSTHALSAFLARRPRPRFRLRGGRGPSFATRSPRPARAGGGSSSPSRRTPRS